MAFVLKQSETYIWPVSFEVPVNGAKHEKHSFDAELKRLPQSRIIEIQDAVYKRLVAVQNEQDTTGMITDQEIAEEVLAGWDGVVDGNGEPVPFTKSSKEQMLEVPTVAAAIVSAYFGSLQGAKRKN